ncbi:uncharacterized protein LTR77_004468 [Saxophila tyrrhenica]|uniref:DUF974 domain-containing protein n=1 Tax=Saxophila tyrrhenica TaxID=1690608 RepID=A0AAV9PFB5_9PEZI|nr:hypothetical protein LTR77_004468 [Saxophila tyrrhenica]
MASHTRAPSTSSGHALSLKVLRLTRPSLATQTPLPLSSFGNGLDLAKDASVAYPGADTGSSFPLTPLLTLPEAFGAAYVGESFICTVCANYDKPEADEAAGDEGRIVSVSGVRITADLQTPSKPQGTPISLYGPDQTPEDSPNGHDLEPGSTLQRTLHHDLKEQGQHVLVVTVSYTETSHTPDGASGGRARTFRKLYQFTAQPLIAVRSKITERKRRAPESGRSWTLEAQLENVGETSVVLEKLWLSEREGVEGKGLNGDEKAEATVLKASDVEQVMFVLRETGKTEEGGGLGRVPLAQLNVEWRSAMGGKGSLTTGWLASRGR